MGSSAFLRPSNNYTVRLPACWLAAWPTKMWDSPRAKFASVKEPRVVASRNIELRVICGVSGSGKTSLALDTLYAEGQRRYIESFSLYTRQFLERLDKPQADRIDGLPASIAVMRDDVSRSSRATIGTATETIDYLRLLYAKIGRLLCPSCGRPISRSSPQTAAEQLAALPDGTRLMIGFAQPLAAPES